MENLPLFLIISLLLQSCSAHSSPSVIIIGAGPAGIAAATKLLENGITKIIVLEAENRVGGRINSVLFGEAYVDLGAEWCHGEKDNVVYDLVKDFNILRHTDPPTTFYHSSKGNIDEEFGEELATIMMEEIYTPDGHRDEEEGRTVGEYCIDRYNKIISERYQKESEKFELAKSSLEFFHHSVLSSEGAFSWFDPSARNDYRECEGDLELNWNGLGYKTVLEILMKTFPRHNKQLQNTFNRTVLLNKEVIKVLYNRGSIKHGVTVKCSDNTSYRADHLIFTPSIGVLKENHERMFVPPLPRNKQEAIKHIGFGAVMKVVMHFEERWWPYENFTGINFLWGHEDKKIVLKQFPEGPVKDGRSWLTYLFSIMPVEHNPNVLIGWFTGDLIPEIEVIPHETMTDGLSFVLSKFLGHQYNVTEPDRLLRSYWYSNPHFRGSYSFQTVNARKSHVTAEVQLAKPILSFVGRPLVQFAGEASHPYYYSTVHGAIETGYREANRIINLYKK